ncbi:unnamed protein product (macronuclear) [Paramecium tetraurelia]|uniref:RING-type domain-containing protein n=1 Tax=Paramecium tetraurelia TaxID=5888 RepID=A0C0B5_PARTE|nr:uncharacterized protein GSPATT00006085001 [Paramecium tetraurelia]CAK64232.1 unnamed protein product [Paramecium tetraurelia]|eukprot:XP_001431630.1 hypothetical protein (macronuclear) [Paramecium tetraurelia strain d4-2]
MGQAQTQQQQDMVLGNEHVVYLQKTATTAAHRIQGNQEEVQFLVKCPKCSSCQFDDQLGRITNCFQCKLVFSVNDGQIQIRPDSTQLEDKRTFQLIETTLHNLESVTFYVNRTKLDPALIKDNVIDFQRLINNVLLPFFSVRQRVLELGIKFSIGAFEFRVVGGFPSRGIITKQTQIYCYGYYIQDTTRRVKILSKKPSQQLDFEIKSYFSVNPKDNQIIQDSTIRVNSQKLLILQCENASGKIDRNSTIESIPNVQNLRDVKLCCIKFPAYFSTFQSQKERIKEAIRKIVINPYFVGLNRYLEKGQILRIWDFEFQVQMFEEQGLVVPNHTQIDIDLFSPIPQQRIQHNRQFDQLFPQNLVPYRRNDLQRQHAQQIEALHRLLNTFIILNENQQLLLQLRNNRTSEDQINQLPIRQISMEFINQHQNDDNHIKCMICLEDYEENQIVRTMPCWHYFHQECIDKWLHKSTLCPICKTEVDTDLQTEEISMQMQQ